MELLENGTLEVVVGVVVNTLLPNFGLFKKTFNNYASKKREEARTFSKVKKSDLYDETVSEELLDEIIENCGNVEIVEMDSYYKALKTNKWISYAMWYMTEEDATLLDIDRPTKEFLNSVSDRAGFGRMYEEYGISNLLDFEVNNPNKVKDQKFIFLMDELKNKLTNPEFIKLMKLKKAKLELSKQKLLSEDTTYSYNAGVGSYIDENGMYHPVFFSSTPIITTIDIKQGQGISDEKFYELNNLLKPLIKDKDYSFSRDNNDNIILTIVRDNTYGSTEQFLIDDGKFMGGTRKSILGCYKTINGTLENIFVDINAFPDIAFNIINRSFYQMTPDEVYTAYSNMLNNYAIYKYIDLSDTRWIDYLTPQEKQVLDNNLTNVITYMSLDPDNSFGIPRLRFESFVDESNFTLMSDVMVKSPYATFGLGSDKIRNNLTIDVVGNNITIYK